MYYAVIKLDGNFQTRVDFGDYCFLYFFNYPNIA